MREPVAVGMRDPDTVAIRVKQIDELARRIAYSEAGSIRGKPFWVIIKPSPFGGVELSITSLLKIFKKLRYFFTQTIIRFRL